MWNALKILYLNAQNISYDTNVKTIEVVHVYFLLYSSMKTIEIGAN